MMYKVKFQYADDLSRWEWRTQQCTLSGDSKEEAREKAIELYGLGVDCDYRILSIEEV